MRLAGFYDQDGDICFVNPAYVDSVIDRRDEGVDIYTIHSPESPINVDADITEVAQHLIDVADGMSNKVRVLPKKVKEDADSAP